MGEREKTVSSRLAEACTKLTDEQQDAILTIAESNVQVNEMIARRAAREQPQAQAQSA